MPYDLLMITVDGALIGEDGELESLTARALASVDAWQFGVELKRRAIGLENPLLSDSEIDACVREWLEADE